MPRTFVPIVPNAMQTALPTDPTRDATDPPAWRHDGRWCWRRGGGWRRGACWKAVVEHSDWLLIVALCAAYLGTFGPWSAIHGLPEVFDQDSWHILSALAAGKPYEWNPANHILYHVLIEAGFAAWKALFGEAIPGGSEHGAFLYLKVFTAATGFAWLVVLRRLLVELRLTTMPRTLVIGVAGSTVSSWFNFAGFETHGLALAPLGLYLLATVRVLSRERWDRSTLVAFVASLVLLGLARVDLFRFAALSALLLAVRPLRASWRVTAGALAAATVLAAAASALLVFHYRDDSAALSLTAVLDRGDRPLLAAGLGTAGNLSASNLAIVGRAVAWYAFAMPTPAPDGNERFEWVHRWRYAPLSDVPPSRQPSTGLFSEPLSNLLRSAVSAAALVAATLVLATALSAWTVAVHRPLVALLSAQAIAGWLLYSWWNPAEPFLWTLEFLPLYLALIAIAPRSRAWWVALCTAALVLPVHNFVSFYLPFR